MMDAEGLDGRERGAEGAQEAEQHNSTIQKCEVQSKRRRLSEWPTKPDRPFDGRRLSALVHRTRSFQLSHFIFTPHHIHHHYITFGIPVRYGLVVLLSALVQLNKASTAAPAATTTTFYNKQTNTKE